MTEWEEQEAHIFAAPSPAEFIIRDWEATVGATLSASRAAAWRDPAAGNPFWAKRVRPLMVAWAQVCLDIGERIPTPIASAVAVTAREKAAECQAAAAIDSIVAERGASGLLPEDGGRILVRRMRAQKLTPAGRVAEGEEFPPEAFCDAPEEAATRTVAAFAEWHEGGNVRWGWRPHLRLDERGYTMSVSVAQLPVGEEWQVESDLAA